MNALIEARRAELLEICKKYGVERLYVFGSAATGGFNESTSDLDFVVQMSEREPTAAYADRYVGLGNELETLFGRRIDLLTLESVHNPYLRREIEATRQLVYERPRQETTV